MRHRIPLFFLLLFFLFLIGQSSASGQEKRLSTIARTLKQLREVKVEDELGYNVPAAVIPLLPRLKHQLLHLFQQVLKEDGQDLIAKSAQRRVLARLHDAGIEVDAPWQDLSGYGYIYKVEVTQPRGHPDLLVFRDAVGINCGEDGSLYVFQKKQGGWRLVIAVESNGYQQVNGGLGGLIYGISPPDAQGRWFLVYAHHLPWCTSAWNGLRYAAVRPGERAYKPQVLVKGSDGLYLGNDYLNLKVTASSFRLLFEAGQSLDVKLLTRVHVVRYRIDGDQAARIAPLARTPEGFLDEWGQLSWVEAKRWTMTTTKAARQNHDLLRDEKLFRELDFVRPSGSGKKWQIQVTVRTEQENQNREAGRTLFATVVQRGETYWLARIVLSKRQQKSSN